MAEEAIKKDPKGKIEYIFAVGRRRGAIARVRLYEDPSKAGAWGDATAKKGEILVNQKPIGTYFHTKSASAAFTQPYKLTGTEGKYITTIKVTGGGFAGQLDAAVHGISRALALLDRDKNRPVLKKKGMLVRDARVRERRKVGTGGKARRTKQSPKR
jgi:small subunit ribosomal protein S9